MEYVVSDEEQELLDGVEDDPTPGWSTTTKSTVGTILVLVMISSIIVFPSLFSVILGLTQSDTVLDSRIRVGDTTVVFDDTVHTELAEIYDSVPDVETALCLYGTARNQTYTVTAYTQPRIYDQGYDFVSHAPCPSNATILFHTHPERRCLPSAQDRRTLRDAQRSNKDKIMLIMCQRDRYTIVT